MSNILEINSELSRLSAALETASNEYTTASRDAADKRTDYDVAWAKGMIKSTEKTVDKREAQVTEECEVFMREARIAEALRDAYKERMRALSAQLNAVQTRAAFEREEMRLAGKDYSAPAPQW